VRVQVEAARATERHVVALWRAPLDVAPATLARLESHLSAEERLRAQRLRRPRDRGRFVAARGWLRQLLGGELDVAPEDVQIVISDMGKPVLPDSDLGFSSAHSGGLALYATSRATDVGVDVEAVLPGIDLDDLARKFLSPAEQVELASLPGTERLTATCQAWACKEAYGKAIGAGLHFPLQTCDVWTATREPALVGGCTVHQVDVAPGYVAAVAGAGLGDWVPSTPRSIDARNP
jgi:4'-phosphopantetheinyl transferase